MNEIKWNDRFNIGVESIDKAHQRLFSIVGKLINLNEDTAKQQHACREGIKYLKNYTLKHFADEEAYMKSIHYDGYSIHKSLHDNMRHKTLPELELELESQNYSIQSVQHFIGICIGWLNGHIMIEDRAITGCIQNKWVHRPSEDEMTSLEKAITQTLDNLFRIKAHTVSIHYDGNDFAAGKAICYRLTYRSSSEKKPLYTYVAYEEQMILSLIGSLLGKDIKRVDNTVTYAFKALSLKFMDCVASHFNLTNGYQYEKTDMLSLEQMIHVFHSEKQYPPYSFLFRVEGGGYFSFFVK